MVTSNSWLACRQLMPFRVTSESMVRYLPKCTLSIQSLKSSPPLSSRSSLLAPPSTTSQSLSPPGGSLAYSLLSTSSEQDPPSTSGCSSDQSARLRTQKELMKALKELKIRLPVERKTKGHSSTLDALKYALNCVKQVRGKETHRGARGRPPGRVLGTPRPLTPGVCSLPQPTRSTTTSGAWRRAMAAAWTCPPSPPRSWTPSPRSTP